MSVNDEFERLVAGLVPQPATRHGWIAVVLTPVASASALVGLCAMSGVNCTVVPSTTGAVAARELPPPDDPFAALVTDVPPAAEELAATLSRLTHTEVLLLVARLGTDHDGETAGQLTAHRYAAGEAAGEVPPGLALASADGVVEDLLLGQVALADVPGGEDTGQIPRWKAARMFTRGLKKRKP